MHPRPLGDIRFGFAQDLACHGSDLAFAVDLAWRQVTREGNVVRLTPTEWNILELLVRNPPRLVTQQQGYRFLH